MQQDFDASRLAVARTVAAQLPNLRRYVLLVVPAQRLVVVVAQQEWWQISAEQAVQNTTGFYNDVFLQLVAGAADSAA